MFAGGMCGAALVILANSVLVLWVIEVPDAVLVVVGGLNDGNVSWDRQRRA